MGDLDELSEAVKQRDRGRIRVNPTYLYEGSPNRGKSRSKLRQVALFLTLVDLLMIGAFALRFATGNFEPQNTALVESTLIVVCTIVAICFWIAS